MPPPFYVAYANYVIYFANLSDYNAAIALAGGVNFLGCPVKARHAFGLPPQVTPLDPNKGIYGFPPYGIPVTPPGIEVLHPGPSGVFLRDDVDAVLVPGQEGSMGTANPIFGEGPAMILQWSGTIVRSGAGAGSNPGPTTHGPIPQRRWAIGFEYPNQTEGTPFVNRPCRDASRTMDGLGFALRGETNKSCLMSLDKYRTGLSTNQSWERIYVRVRVADGAVPLDIWQTAGNPSPAAGVKLYINPDLSLEIFNVTAGSVETSIGTSEVGLMELGKWKKIDLVPQYNAGSGHGRIRVYVNGTQIFDINVASGSGGLGTNAMKHSQTHLGTQTAAANTWEIDFDDWTNADVPSLLGSLDSIDWIGGTHIRRQVILTANLPDFTGEVEALNGMMAPVNELSSLTSAVSGAIIEALTDLTDEQVAVGIVMGNITSTISQYGKRATGPGNGDLGYSLAGDPEVYVAISEGTANQYNFIAYLSDGLQVVPDSIVPFEIFYRKAADTNLATIVALACVVEQVGTWGAEDDATLVDQLPQSALIHNAPYPNIAWAFYGPTPDGPVQVVSGTYVGNDTTTSLDFALPVHMLLIRPVGVNSPGIKWFSSGLGAHLGGQQAVIPDHAIRVFWDDINGVCTAKIVGNSAASNANGTTYQYIAVCDPGLRYMLNTALMHSAGLASADNALIDSTFTPEAAFYNTELTSASSTVKMAYKGNGNSANGGTRVDGTDLADFATLAQGLLTSRTDSHVTGQQLTFALFRSDDGSGLIMFQIMSYVGDGTGNRTITLTPTSGRYPVYAFVQPHGAEAIFRDPSHTGFDSSRFNAGTILTTGIRGGGIDTLNVGSTLNANGVTYDVFVIPGDINSWQNGIYYPPNELPPGDEYPPVDGNPVADLNLLPEGGLVLNGQPAITLLKDVSGIYTLIPNQTHDTLYDRLTGQTSVNVKIPNPVWKTGYIGG